MQAYREACEGVRALFSAEEDEAEPYRNKYEAARKLEAARKELDGNRAPCAAAARGLLECRRGLALLETDLLPDGEGAVASGLELLNEFPGEGRSKRVSIATAHALTREQGSVVARCGADYLFDAFLPLCRPPIYPAQGGGQECVGGSVVQQRRL